MGIILAKQNKVLHELCYVMWQQDIQFIEIFNNFRKACETQQNYEKRCFATDLATQFLSCNDHLQLTVFLHYEWYQTSFMSCKRCNSPYRWCISLKFNYNFIETTHFQLLCNSITITVTMSCWCYLFHPSTKI